jgi:hypothetical protein
MKQEQLGLRILHAGCTRVLVMASAQAHSFASSSSSKIYQLHPLSCPAAHTASRASPFLRYTIRVEPALIFASGPHAARARLRANIMRAHVLDKRGLDGSRTRKDALRASAAVRAPCQRHGISES